MLLLPGPRAPERNSISSSPRQSKTRYFYPTALLDGPDAVQVPLGGCGWLGTLFNPSYPKGCLPSSIAGAVQAGTVSFVHGLDGLCSGRRRDVVCAPAPTYTTSRHDLKRPEAPPDRDHHNTRMVGKCNTA